MNWNVSWIKNKMFIIKIDKCEDIINNSWSVTFKLLNRPKFKRQGLSKNDQLGKIDLWLLIIIKVKEQPEGAL